MSPDRQPVQVVVVTVPWVLVVPLPAQPSAVRYWSTCPWTVGSGYPLMVCGVPPGLMVSSGSAVPATSSSDTAAGSGHGAALTAPGWRTAGGSAGTGGPVR